MASLCAGSGQYTTIPVAALAPPAHARFGQRYRAGAGAGAREEVLSRPSPQPRMDPRRPADSCWPRASSRSVSLERRHSETPARSAASRIRPQLPTAPPESRAAAEFRPQQASPRPESQPTTTLGGARSRQRPAPRRESNPSLHPSSSPPRGYTTGPRRNCFPFWHPICSPSLVDRRAPKSSK